MERRCSAITLGLVPLPAISSENPSRRQSTTDTWDYYYPGIHVTQPTPKTSPCPSEISINEKRKIGRHKSLIEQDSFDCISEYPAATINNNVEIQQKTTKLDGSSVVDNNSSKIIRRAPLASLSSFKVSSVDYQDSDLRSLGSDSVFAESYADTDDDMEQFSTDSDEISDAQSPPNTRTTITAQRSGIGSNCSTISADIEPKPRAYIDGGAFDDFPSVCLSSTKNDSVTLLNTFETKAIIERHQHQNATAEQLLSIRPAQQYQSATPPSSIRMRSAAYGDGSGDTINNSNVINLSSYNNDKPNSNQNINEINRNNNYKTSECVDDVNVVVVDNRSIVSPSVILELPVITTQETIEQPIDPSLPGPSRKWSKETLF